MKTFIARTFSVAVALILLGLFPARPARAAVGALLQTVDVPTAAVCSSGLGTSVTLVPGSMIARDDIPVLLVTSCYQSSASSLFFLDFRTNPATLVATINTSPTPPLGWGALSLRGDRGDLIGCGNASDGSHAIYSIDISPYNGMVDGTATFLFNGAAGNDICDGLAWDTGTDTVFQSPDVSSTIYQYSASGTLLSSFPSPAGCPNSGLAVGGASLFAACDGNLVVYQIDKSDGTVFTSFPSAGTRTEDLECDPITFAGTNKDAIWSKDAYTNQLFAFEVPDGTCGFAGGPPVVPAKCSDGSVTDTDGDALLDCWETDGIDFDGDGTIDLELYDVDGDGTIEPNEKADPMHKDIYLEVDWMAQHQPNAAAILAVINSFASAPVANPDGTPGVRLHVQTDENAVAHNSSLAFQPCTQSPAGGVPDYDTVKNSHFGTAAERAAAASTKVLNAKRSAVRYLLFAHNLLGLGGTSGCAELPGNDFVVSLGSWTIVAGHGVGDTDEQAGTLMHELGHTIGLRHGGGDHLNCKPNYLSVMSYTRQINNNPIIGRPLDYSAAALATLDEADLDEPLGIGGPAGQSTAYGPPPLIVSPADGAIDWNRDGDAVDLNVSANVNLTPSCNGSGAILAGYNDWANLNFDFRSTVDFADGVHLSVLAVDEVTFDEALAISPDSDGDGLRNLVDNCTFVANPGQVDSNQDGMGDACVKSTSGFLGTAQGGTIQFSVNGVTLVIQTFPGESAATVAAKIAAAINGSQTLSLVGVSAVSSGASVSVTEKVNDLVITDPGITLVSASVVSVPTLSTWAIMGLVLLLGLAGFLLIRHAF